MEVLFRDLLKTLFINVLSVEKLVTGASSSSATSLTDTAGSAILTESRGGC